MVTCFLLLFADSILRVWSIFFPVTVPLLCCLSNSLTLSLCVCVSVPASLALAVTGVPSGVLGGQPVVICQYRRPSRAHPTRPRSQYVMQFSATMIGRKREKMRIFGCQTHSSRWQAHSLSLTVEETQENLDVAPGDPSTCLEILLLRLKARCRSHQDGEPTTCLCDSKSVNLNQTFLSLFVCAPVYLFQWICLCV